MGNLGKEKIMVKTKQEIIDEIMSYILENDPNDEDWYVGITKDIEERLFTFHNVNKDSGAWIWRRASSSDIAREIESYFLELGADGGPGGGDDDTDIVYAYKITDDTKER
jgi:hypothetical protein